MKLVSQAIMRKSKRDSSTVEHMVDHFLGPFPRMVSGLKAEALLLVKSRTHFGDEVETLASAVHFGSKVWLGSMFSHLATQAAADRTRIVSVCFFRLYDSTQLMLGVDTKQLRWKSPDIGSVPGKSLPAGAQALEAKYHIAQSHSTERIKIKVMQSSVSVGILTQIVETGRYFFCRCPVSCPLQIVDHEIAEALEFLLQEQQAIPMLGPLLEHAGTVLQLATSDDGSANLKFEALEAPAQKEPYKKPVLRHSVIVALVLLHLYRLRTVSICIIDVFCTPQQKHEN
jgi:hypothetical protein